VRRVRWAAGAVAVLAIGAAGATVVMRPRPVVAPAAPPAAWSAAPVASAGLPSGGLVHTCLLLTSGQAFCWGTNNYAQLGNGTNRPSLLPRAVTADSPLVQIDAGDSHTCAVTRGGTVLCWGLAARGQIGPARDATCIAGGLPYPCEPAPRAVPGLPAMRTVGGGADHSCALAANGVAWCWGANDRGQLGRGLDPGSYPARAVSGRPRFASLSIGQFHNCGVTPGGEVLCWGWNVYGQLGTTLGGERCGPNPWSPTPCRNLPVRAEARVRFTAVAAGAKHTCALAADSTAYCWGANRLGQLGTGDTASAKVPKAVAGAHRFRALAAGTDFTCGLSADGVWCWGDNSLGQLGGTERPTSPTPVHARLSETVTAIGAGAGHACAILERGAAACWGAGTAGQLGNGFRSDNGTPVPVRGDAAQRQRAR